MSVETKSQVLPRQLSGSASEVAEKLKRDRHSHVVAIEFTREQRNLESAFKKAVDIVFSSLVLHTHKSQSEKMERFCQVLLEDVELPRTGIVELQMRAKAIRHLIEKGKWLTAGDIARHGSYSSSNPSEPANRWKKEGKIFAVNFKGQDLYATYQFDDQIQPRPVIKEVLQIFKDKQDTWKIAAWFGSINSWLSGKRPQDCLDTPGRIVEAAGRELAGFDG